MHSHLEARPLNKRLADVLGVAFDPVLLGANTLCGTIAALGSVRAILAGPEFS